MAKVADPDAAPGQQQAALEDAAEATQKRIRLIEKTKKTRTQYPYPTVGDLKVCVDD